MEPGLDVSSRFADGGSEPALSCTGDALELPGEGLTLIAYTAEPGSRAQDQLDLLASWSTSNTSPVERTPVIPPTP